MRMLKTHCSRGHVRTPETINSKRDCRLCMPIRAAERKKKFPDERRNYDLVRCYGITSDDYDRMLADQNYCCAACGKHESNNFGRRLDVDHDHATGEVRALLCRVCNRLVGVVESNVAVRDYCRQYVRVWRNDLAPPAEHLTGASK